MAGAGVLQQTRDPNQTETRIYIRALLAVNVNILVFELGTTNSMKGFDGNVFTSFLSKRTFLNACSYFREKSHSEQVSIYSLFYMEIFILCNL